jgi:ketosteroid isomerase-like protein
MSQENLEIVRLVYEQGWLDRHPERVLAAADPDVEYVNPPEAIEPATRRGLVEVGHALRNLQEAFDESRHELRDLFPSGEVVVAAVSFVTRSRGSEAEVVQDEAHTWTFRNGRIVRFEWGRDLQAALEAAGLRE